MDDMRELMAPYVLNALDEDERRRFEAYLEEHPELADELATMRAGVAGLVESVAVEPPATLRASVLDAIVDTPQETTRIAARRSVPMWRRWLAAGAVATAAAVAVLVGATVGGGGVTPQDVLAAADVRSVTAPVGVADARLDYSLELAAAVVTFDDLPDVTDDETFQLWVIGDAGPTSAGIFRPGTGATQVLLQEPVTPGVVVGLTVEPAGGSDQPTGEILATWSVST